MNCILINTLSLESGKSKHHNQHHYRCQLRNLCPPLPGPAIWNHKDWDYLRTYCHRLALLQFLL